MIDPINTSPFGYKSLIRAKTAQDTLSGISQSSNKVNQPFIMDLITLETLYFQTIPQSIDVDPGANWVALASLGANNPGYQYTGGEDTITFDLSWYCNDESREDVLTKCKWLEALSKANGYEEDPHPVLLSFGKMFKDSKFIINHAPYKLGVFIREFEMLPGLATQSLTFKRITEVNQTYTEIRKLTT